MSDMTRIRLAEARPLGGFRPIWIGPSDTIAVPEPDEPEGDPYAKGYSDGVSAAEAAFAAERERYRALIASMEALQAEPSEELALLIAETVEGLVRLTVGEVSVDRDVLLERAKRAAAVAADADSARTLHLNPADIPLLDLGDVPLAVVADPTVAPGSVRVEDSAGWVEDGVSVHLETLREQLGLKDPAQ